MNKLWITITLLFLTVFGTTIAAADHHAVKIARKEDVGSYLTDAKGMTLYWFKKDAVQQSVCNDGCLEKWPIYYRVTVVATQGLNAGDFGVITRADGRKQSTFRGYPLYYFFKDANPGDTLGHGVKEVWYVVDPADFPKQ